MNFHDNPLVAVITLAIAVWGAITGTIALFLEWRKHRKDNAVLVIKPDYEQSFSTSYPPEVRFRVTIVNKGHRTAHLAELWIRVRAPTAWRDIVWTVRRRGWVPAHGYRFSNLHLDGGKSMEFYPDIPDGIALSRIKRVSVRDQTGRKWKSGWRFGQRRIQRVLDARTIFDDTIEGGHRDRSVYLQHICMGGSEGVLVTEKSGNTTRWRMPRFGSSDDAVSLYAQASTLALQFTNGEIDDLISKLDG